ncbi:hypothetical protein ACXYMX_07330 [Sporosarcina sp. CAU 1771]
MIEAIVIVALVISIPVIAIVTDHKRRLAKIKVGSVREEIELEKLKQQNYIIETEKMKLELEKMKLSYTSDVDELTKL